MPGKWGTLEYDVHKTFSALRDKKKNLHEIHIPVYKEMPEFTAGGTHEEKENMLTKMQYIMKVTDKNPSRN